VEISALLDATYRGRTVETLPKVHVCSLVLSQEWKIIELMFHRSIPYGTLKWRCISKVFATRCYA